MELLEFALQMERQGYDFYTQAAEKVNDNAARDMLLSLARDEKKHEQIISQIMAGELGQIKAPPLVGVQNVFQQLIEQNKTFAAQDHLIRVCNEALDVEKKSVEMYQQIADNAENPQHKDLWLKLKTEEQKHVKLLSLTVDFVHQPNLVLENSEFLFYGDNFSPESY